MKIFRLSTFVQLARSPELWTAQTWSPELLMLKLIAPALVWARLKVAPGATVIVVEAEAVVMFNAITKIAALRGRLMARFVFMRKYCTANLKRR